MDVTKYTSLVEAIIKTNVFEICKVTTSQVVNSPVVTLQIFAQSGDDVYVIELDVLLDSDVIKGAWVLRLVEGYSYDDDHILEALDYTNILDEALTHVISEEEYGVEAVRHLGDLLRVLA